MAGIAVCRRTRKHIVDVARGTSHAGMETGQRERRVVVIERCAGPIRCRVASVAGKREPGRRVGRIRRTHVKRMVATVASSGQGPLIAICRGVARRTLHGCVEASEGERRRTVVERRRRPVRCRVAGFAGSWEARSNVRRIRGSSKVSLVA